MNAKILRKDVIKDVTRIILKHANPERIYLYGSQISGDAVSTSDIDIAYMDANCKNLHLIKEEIDKLPTLVKIDITNLAFAEERFKNRVISTGKILFSANKKLRAQDGLHNFAKALERFVSMINQKEDIYKDGYSDFYLDLAVKRFEFTFEMSWKAIKRFLDFTGIGCTSPRSCLKEAYAQQLLADEGTWLDMIELRNLSNHTYNEYEINEILDKLDLFNQAFQDLKKNLESQLASL